jgi:hypothetical protein
MTEDAEVLKSSVASVGRHFCGAHLKRFQYPVVVRGSSPVKIEASDSKVLEVLTPESEHWRGLQLDPNHRLLIRRSWFEPRSGSQEIQGATSRGVAPLSVLIPSEPASDRPLCGSRGQRNRPHLCRWRSRLCAVARESSYFGTLPRSARRERPCGPCMVRALREGSLCKLDVASYVACALSCLRRLSVLSAYPLAVFAGSACYLPVEMQPQSFDK